jgi:hypothetical protein
MVEEERIVVTGNPDELPHGTVFKFVTPEGKEVSHYFVMIGPVGWGTEPSNLLRAFELKEEDGHLIRTRVNTVILPRVRVKVYLELTEY